MDCQFELVLSLLYLAVSPEDDSEVVCETFQVYSVLVLENSVREQFLFQSKKNVEGCMSVPHLLVAD